YSWRTYKATTALDPALLLRTVGQEVREIDPNVGISASGTLEGSLRAFYRGPQFELVTLGSFATIGLLLVTIGISSVMVYTVSLRTHEIGIRMAHSRNRDSHGARSSTEEYSSARASQRPPSSGGWHSHRPS